MAYTLSCDASVKVGKEAVRGLLHHTMRDVDRMNDCEVKHKNQMIDGERTSLNVSYVRDGDGWTRCTNIRQAQDALKARLKDVKKTIRHDAVVLRELLLEMDPRWMADHPDEDEREQSLEDMMDGVKARFGDDNIVFYSIHKDESNWHIHVGVCPVSDDGRLAQKDWFGSPAKLREMHDKLREHMQGRGYDIQKKEKRPGDPSRHLTDEEYKAFRDALAAQKAAVVAQAQAEADNIRATARDEAEEIRATARKTAQQEADAIRIKAEQDAGKIRQDAQDDLNREWQTIDVQRKYAEQYKKKLMEEAEAEAEAIKNRAQEAAERVQKAAEAEAGVKIADAWQEAQEVAMTVKVDMDVAASVLESCKAMKVELTEQQRTRMAALALQRQTLAAQAEAVLHATDITDEKEPDELSPPKP